MNDREKMLALVAEWRREAGQLRMLRDVAADRNAEHIEKCAADLEALLTEPTLEEVLAELATYGFVNLEDCGPHWTATVLCYEDDGKGASAETPLQAARECLRRVKE